MKASQTLIFTLREDPSDAVVPSHRLLLRAGFIAKLGSGLYHYLPLGLRVLRKIENIVREEMDNSGMIECLSPILTPAELWEKSSRWDLMGKELFRLEDRHQNWLALGPTHEESFTDLLKNIIRSYKDLPKSVYQIHTKFRDEIRPRFGLMRCREFIMKDAYSYHANEKCLDQTYKKMRKTYEKIFQRMNLSTISVEANTGAMGGNVSEEFMIASEVGEEVILVGPSEDKVRYASNQEKTPVVYLNKLSHKTKATKSTKELKKIHTPNIESIEKLANFLDAPKDTLLKAIAYLVDQKAVLIFMRGDRDLNESKLKNCLEATEVLPANLENLKNWGIVPGFIGPWNLKPKEKIEILWDDSSLTREKWICGANEKDYHYKNFQLDYSQKTYDLALAQAGDPVPNKENKQVLENVKGIELGHIFKLGQKYTQAMGMSINHPDDGILHPWMGCYGIGIGRSMSAIVEQYHDEKGIIFPKSVAPYEVVLIGIYQSKEEEKEISIFYEALKKEKIDVLWDERDLRPGVKFKDAELIGFPLRIVIGKNYFAEKIIELYERQNEKKHLLKGNKQELVQEIKTYF